MNSSRSDREADYMAYGRLAEAVEADLQAGKQPDPAELADRFPELRGQLTQLLPALQALHEAAQDPSGGVAAGRATTPPPTTMHVTGTLGDYRIIREIGRGGMGVVYQAEQISLRRSVALKILPLAAVFDSRQLRRFRNEAQAAAHLHHPHIVPVHGIGCERGVHYYAMQFINGRTLGDLLAELRAPSAAAPQHGSAISSSATRLPPEPGRSAPPQPGDALLGNQPAEPPLDSAAAIRPTTSLSDVLPVPLAAEPADAAPARPASARGSTARVARQQAAVSTLRAGSSASYFRTVAQWMIQVLDALDHAHREGILHRDIKPSNLILDQDGKVWVTDFGLARLETEAGVTVSGDILGTLAYMSPEQLEAKRGLVDHRADIYAVGATLYELLTQHPVFGYCDRQTLLRRIMEHEPRPLRRWNSAIPNELQTIVLTALAKNPVERYETAQDMADDLRKFLQDLPIRARKPSLLVRATKWARRHRAAVLAASLAVFLSLAGSTLVLWHQNRQIQTQKQLVERERQRAETNFRLAVGAVDQLLDEVASRDLLNVPHMEPLRKELLSKALSFYETLLQQQANDNIVQRELAQAHYRMGEIQQQLGDFEAAERCFQVAAEQFVTLCKRQEPCQLQLARVENSLGLLYKDRGQLDRAESVFTRAIRMTESLGDSQQEQSDFYFVLAGLYQNRGQLAYLRGQAATAEAEFHRSRQIQLQLVDACPEQLSYQDHLASSLQNLGYLYHHTSRLDEASAYYQQALDMRQKLVVLDPQNIGFQSGLAQSYVSRGALHQTQGKLDAAVADFTRSRDMWLQLVSRHPAVPDFQLDLAASCHNLSIVHRGLGQLDPAFQCLYQAQAIRESLVQRFPNLPTYQREWALGFVSLANAHLDAEQADEALPPLETARRVQEQLVATFPDSLEYRVDLAATLYSLGRVQVVRDQTEGVRQLWDRAGQLLQDALRVEPGHRRALEFRANLLAGQAVLP